MLIALSGGSAFLRVALAQKLAAESNGRLVLHAQESPQMPKYASKKFEARAAGKRRANLLSEVLEGRSRRVGLVLVDCLSEHEADLIRAQGGSVWHLYGEPSDFVAIRKGDPIVSMQLGMPEHVTTPLDAYSQMVLSRRADAQRAAPHV